MAQKKYIIDIEEVKNCKNCTLCQRTIEQNIEIGYCPLLRNIWSDDCTEFYKDCPMQEHTSQK